jgi:hypothetical protein
MIAFALLPLVLFLTIIVVGLYLSVRVPRR